ncbi:MAG: anti-sigma factor family protein [Aridibacter sp.]
MKCEELQFNLPLYIDDILSDDERALLDKHLPRCPLCRQKLSEYKELRNNLRIMPRPTIPANLMQNIRSAVAVETRISQPMFSPLFTETFADRIRQFVMPYSVATFASLVIGVSLFFLIGSPETNPLDVAMSEKMSNDSVLMENSNIENEDLNLGADDFPKISLTNTPPSINPTGALVALTKSFVRGKMKDEEVVIVADVFSNGLARVSEVVEPPKDQATMLEIQKALENDPEDASFLPAKADNRSDKVTFIFKIQRVDVKYQKPAKKQRK